MYNTFSCFLFPRSLSSHSQKPLSLSFLKKWVSLKNLAVAATPRPRSPAIAASTDPVWHSRRHENHLLPPLSSSISKSDLGIILRIRFRYYLAAVSFSDLIWEFFFVRFSLEIPGVKMGMKRLLGFFYLFDL